MSATYINEGAVPSGPRCACGNVLTIEDEARCRQCVLTGAQQPLAVAVPLPQADSLQPFRDAFWATKPGTSERRAATRAWLAAHPTLN